MAKRDKVKPPNYVILLNEHYGKTFRIFFQPVIFAEKFTTLLTHFSSTIEFRIIPKDSRQITQTQNYPERTSSQIDPILAWSKTLKQEDHEKWPLKW